MHHQLEEPGDGLPNSGFFTPDQFQKTATEPLSRTIPARGVMEVKPTQGHAGGITE
jgi:hypothetical protein